VLVTHHVELVLPATHSLIRLLDGRIELQGSIQELRERGVLNYVAHNAVGEIEEIKKVESDEELVDGAAKDSVDDVKPENVSATKDKKPKKLVKDEARATGNVKWHIYKTYLEAS